MPTESEMFQLLLRELGDKVDKSRNELTSRLDLLPTRHELDIVNETINGIRSDFGKFVLRTEFQLNNDNVRASMELTNKLNADKFAVIVPRIEIEKAWRDIDKQLEGINVKLTAASQFPAWATAIIVGVLINAGATALEHFVK